MKKSYILLIIVIIMFLNTDIGASQLSTLTKEQQDVEQKISTVNDKIMGYEDEINALNKDIDSKNKTIEKLEKNKEKNEKEIEKARVNLDPGIAALQKVSNTNVLATYFYDENTLDNNYFLKLNNINKILDSFSGDMMKFVNAITTAKAEIDEQNELKDQINEDLKKVNEKRKEQAKIETQLKGQLAEVEKKIGKVSLTTSGSASSSQKNAIMSAAGISSSDYQYVDYIIKKESGWNATAANPMSSAYGLCQALPGSKMASAGSDWKTNPITQMKWCNSYATSRYGSWSSAYNFWISHHWW